MSDRTVKQSGEATSPAVWQKALGCGDMLDRFPCASCGASRPSECARPLSPSQVEATRDYINGYGWAAAKRLAERGEHRERG